MTWEEGAAAAKVLFEEKVGTLHRALEAAETSQADATIQAIRDTEGRR